MIEQQAGVCWLLATCLWGHPVAGLAAPGHLRIMAQQARQYCGAAADADRAWRRYKLLHVVRKHLGAQDAAYECVNRVCPAGTHAQPVCWNDVLPGTLDHNMDMESKLLQPQAADRKASAPSPIPRMVQS